jgi:uncharacterized membrane protein
MATAGLAQHEPTCEPGRQRRHMGANNARKQQGAIGLFGIAALLIAMLFMSLSVDTGRLWLERRSVQRAADMAAMASARFTGCGSTADQALNAAKATVKENGIDPALVTAADVKTGVITFDNAGRTVFTAKTSVATNAAQVSVQKVVPASILLGGFYNNATITLKATAIAQGGPPLATYSVGSVYGISAEGAKQISNLFKGVLGSKSPTLNTVAINALVGSTVTLQALQQADIDITGVPITLDAFLKKSMTVSEFLQRIALASPSANNLQAFQDLVTAAQGYPGTVMVSQILNIQSPPASGVSSASISVFDLVNAGINVGAISQGGVINLSLGLGILGKTTLSILSPPIIAIGPAGKDAASGLWCSQSQSAQMSLRSTLAPFKFPGLDLSIIDIALRVDTLVTTGHLEELSLVPGQISGKLSSQSTIVTLVLTNSTDVDKPIGNLSGFGIGYIGPKLLNTGFKIYLPVGQSNAEEATFSYTSTSNLPSTKILGAGGLGDTIGGLIGKDTYIEARLLGLKVPLSDLGNILGLVTQPLGNAIDGLLEGMGIHTGSVKMQVIDVDPSTPILRQ